jgi:VIT1/CCC1 family predicted Fe2+/Mn2+ transporter
LALATVGAATSLFTGRGLVFSAARQLGIGYAAAIVTYCIGRIAGVALG